MKTINELISKYNTSAPRYTSYPPLPFWKNAPNQDTWFSHLASKSEDGVDLYVHIPYCEKLCWYCGCNRVITKDHSVEEKLIELLSLEWNLYEKSIGPLKVNSLHLGGGTPTFLSPKNLKKLISALTKNKSDNFIGSIEVDPRTCTLDHLKTLKELGFQRISLGIQDFDQRVQKSINRYQPVSLVKSLVDHIRALDFESINFDLIYGLPNQTIESVQDTIKIVNELNPDLIAFYGYAHLPSKISNQKLIRSDELPTPELRQKLYETGKELLTSSGLVDIGMDHFAKETNYLCLAKMNGNLHRNFMGYTDKKSKCLIGLGPSAISDSGLSFIQNQKEFSLYQQALEAGDLPYSIGHIQSESDLIAQKHILTLMCQEKVKISSELENLLTVTRELEDLANDGLLTITQQTIKLTETGKLFMRNVASCFDHHLRQQKTGVRFSQTV
ncbi:MAG TPA: oxygen-independent coproporphyrinogen III oxidase [Bacteriovoracaceae bacterium]|nr:oxygen-independent coproporphyrinogen III oxidase [Bacteriovoracaceae bacterium]